jgi:hypothetical protein
MAGLSLHQTLHRVLPVLLIVTAAWLAQASNPEVTSAPGSQEAARSQVSRPRS